MTRTLLCWIKRLMTSYAYTPREKQTMETAVDEARAAIDKERAAFEERIRNVEARFERLDLQGELMEKPHGPKSD